MDDEIPACEINPKVEKEMSVPQGQYGNHGRKYPFHEMQVGDSFAVCIPDRSRGLEVAQRVRAAARNYGMRYKKKFTVRRVPDIDGMYTVRCWRIP